MVSILEALTRRNVGINSVAPPGRNTIVAHELEVESWTSWTEFNYKTLSHIFRTELAMEYEGEREPRPLDDDLQICSEDTLDVLLHRFPIPTINYALASQQGSCYFGRGSRCGEEIKPDWSVTSPNCLSEGSYINVLPGDTKLDSKWWPQMIHGLTTQVDEWKKVMAQIIGYMVLLGSRYGFIIMDANLVVLRITLNLSTDNLVEHSRHRPYGLTSSH